MKRNIKIFIDIIMLILLIVLMSYITVEVQTHEILGFITMFLFGIHLFLNRQWFTALNKGKYCFRRCMYLVVNILLIIALCFVIISSLLISSYVFSFLPFKTSHIGRIMHLASTSWLFILVSIHIGLHFNVILYQLNKRTKQSRFQCVIYLILFSWYAYGFIVFKNAKLWNDMFVINEFKFFDYSLSPFLICFRYISIAYFVSMTCYMISKNRKNYEVRENLIAYRRIYDYEHNKNKTRRNVKN